MANEIKLANMETPTDVISAAISRALIDKVVCIPHVFAENLPVGTATKNARKDAALGLAAVVAEADAVAAYADFTQTSVALTAAKTAIASKITVEVTQFGGLSDEQVIQKQASSIQRKLDNDIKALAAGFSQSVVCDSVLIMSKLFDAQYIIEAGYAGSDGRNLVLICDYKGAAELKKELAATGATAWSNVAMLSLLTGLAQPNGYAGSLPGIDVYKVGGLPTNAGKRRAMLINPELALFGMYSPSVNVLRKNPDGGGFYSELASYVFNQVAEWNDAAGVMVESTQ